MSSGRSKLHHFSLLRSLVNSKKVEHNADRPYTNQNSRLKRVKYYNHGLKQINPKESFTQNLVRRRKGRTNQQNLLCAPQYGQKRLKKSLLESVDTQKGQIIVRVNIRKELYKEEQRLYKWLCNRFPKCFNPLEKKPLKIGISEDIKIVYCNEQLFPINISLLGRVMKNYVNDISYQRSVIMHKKRFDLHGKATSEFKNSHIEYAKRYLDRNCKIKED